MLRRKLDLPEPPVRPDKAAKAMTDQGQKGQGLENTAKTKDNWRFGTNQYHVCTHQIK